MLLSMYPAYEAVLTISRSPVSKDTVSSNFDRVFQILDERHTKGQEDMSILTQFEAANTPPDPQTTSRSPLASPSH